MDILENITLTARLIEDWSDYGKKAAKDLAVSSPAEIPDEQARINDDGTITIFVSIAGIEYARTYPKSDWAWKS